MPQVVKALLGFLFLMSSACSVKEQGMSINKSTETTTDTTSTASSIDTTVSLSMEPSASFRWATSPLQSNYISRSDAAEVAFHLGTAVDTLPDPNSTNVDFVTLSGYCNLGVYTGGYVTWELFDSNYQSCKLDSEGNVSGLTYSSKRLPAWAQSQSFEAECVKGRFNVRVPLLMGLDPSDVSSPTDSQIDWKKPRPGAYLIDLKIHGTKTDSVGRKHDFTPEQGGTFRSRIIVSQASICPPISCKESLDANTTSGD